MAPMAAISRQTPRKPISDVPIAKAIVVEIPED